MTEHDDSSLPPEQAYSATSGGVPVAPDPDPTLAATGIPWEPQEHKRRLITISVLTRS